MRRTQQGGTRRPIVAIVDVKSQAYGYREETLGIHLACAAAVDAYASARDAGHPVIALIVGPAMSGAFLAHGYQANRIVALDAPGTMVHAMGKEAAARVTRRTVEALEALGETIVPMSYSMASFAKLGLLDQLIEGVDADAPDRRADRARASGAERFRFAARATDKPDLSHRLESSCGAKESRRVDRSAAASRRTMGCGVMQTSAQRRRLQPISALRAMRAGSRMICCACSRLPQFDGEPAWVREAFERAPYRRRQTRAGRRRLRRDRLAWRGARRNVTARGRIWTILKRRAPEALALAQSACGDARRRCPAGIRHARRVAPRGRRIEAIRLGADRQRRLRTGDAAPTVTLSSDLDLLIRTPEKLSHASAIQLLNQLQAHRAMRRHSRGRRSSKRPRAALRWPSGPPAKHA